MSVPVHIYLGSSFLVWCRQMSLSALASFAALGVSLSLWWASPQPLPRSPPVELSVSPPAPPASFDCRCVCPTPSPSAEGVYITESYCPYWTLIGVAGAGFILGLCCCCCFRFLWPVRQSEATIIAAPSLLRAIEPPEQTVPVTPVRRAISGAQRRAALRAAEGSW